MFGELFIYEGLIFHYCDIIVDRTNPERYTMVKIPSRGIFESLNLSFKRGQLNENKFDYRINENSPEELARQRYAKGEISEE